MSIRKAWLLLSLLFFSVAVPAHAVILAEFDFEEVSGETVPNLGVGPDGFLLEGATVEDGVLKTEGAGSGLDIPFGILSPFGGESDWSVQFDFRTEDVGGPLFSSDSSDCPDECNDDVAAGSLNIFLSEEAEVVADAWFIGGISGGEGLNDGEFHTVRLNYTAEESLWELFVDDLEEPTEDAVFEYVRDATLDRTRLADQTNPDFGFEDIDPDMNGITAEFDNLIIDAPAPPPIFATVDRETGEIVIESISEEDVNFNSFSVISNSGSLNPEAWTPIAGRLDSAGDESVATTEWTVQTETAELLNETGDAGAITAEQTFSLGEVWLSSPLEDVRIEIFDTELGEAVRAAVSYSGEESVFADLNGDGELTGLDWEAFVEGFGSDLDGLTGRDAYFLADLNVDGLHDGEDFIAFSEAFDAANGEGAFAAMLAAVPEPTGLALLGFGLLALFRFRGSRTGGRAASHVAMLLIVACFGVVAVGIEEARAELLVEYLFDEDTADSSGNGRDGDLDSGLFGLGGDPFVGDGVLTLTGAPGESLIVPLNEANPFDGSQDFTIDISFMLEEHEEDGAGHLLFSSADFDFPTEGDNHSMSIFVEPEGEIVYDNFFVGEVRLAPPESPIGSETMHSLRVTYVAPEEPGPEEPGRMFMQFDGVWLTEGEIAPNVPSIGNHEVRVGSSLNEEFPFECFEGECFIRDLKGQVDEIRVYDEAFEPSGMRAEVNRENGDVTLIGGEFARDVRYYELSSEAGSLNGRAWSEGNLDAQEVDAVGEGSGETWDTLTRDSNRVVEAFLLGSTVFDEETTLTLPGTWAGGEEDLTLEVITSDNETVGVEVSFIGEGEGNPGGQFDLTNICESGDVDGVLEELVLVLADADADGSVGVRDFLVLSRNFNQPGDYQQGDFDCNGTVNVRDFLILSRNFGASSAAEAATVPEPTSGLMLLFTSLVGLTLRKRR